MKYEKVREGRFISRPNRFTAIVEIDGKEEVVHVKNTGRCRELLLPDSVVYLSEADNENRKTKYDLIAVIKERENGGPLVINIDSQAVNTVVAEALAKGFLFPEKSIIRREVTYGRSRFDFYIENSAEKAFLEVKGVTLESDGKALFPDAPTERGVKHIKELMSCMDEGYSAYVLFVIQIKGIGSFSPNDVMHGEFGDALREAHKKGVNILAVNCSVTADTLEIDSFAEVLL